MRVAVRPFAAGDADGICDLILPIQNEEFGLPITWEEQPDMADIESYYCAGKGGFWVAVSGDRIVGSIALAELSHGNCALRKMFVAADYRGSEFGIAASLLNILIARARDTDLSRVYLGTTTAFKAAHRFYEKHGFGRVDPESLPEGFSRMKADTRFYLLNLD